MISRRCRRARSSIYQPFPAFRPRRPMSHWYGHTPSCARLQQRAVYGLVEIYRDEIKRAQLVRSSYTTCAELALIPLLRANAVVRMRSVINAE